MSGAGIKVVGQDVGIFNRDGKMTLRITADGDIKFEPGAAPSQAAADLIDAVGAVTRIFGWDASTTGVSRMNAALDALAAAVGDTYVCTRVWEAWSVGTMSQDDFTPLAETPELLHDILGEVLAALGVRTTVPPIPLTPAEVNALPDRARDYLMWLHTDADPAGTIQHNYRLTQENMQLRALLAVAEDADGLSLIPPAREIQPMRADESAAESFNAALTAKGWNAYREALLEWRRLRPVRPQVEPAPAPAAGDTDTLARRIDLALNGTRGAAPSAQLVDIVAQCEAEVRRRGAPILAGFPRAPLSEDERSMLAWLERKGGFNVSVTPLDIADFELAGWSSARAHHVLTSLRKQALVECPASCEGRVSILVPQRSP
jgi:hypothetical protein